LEEEKNYQHLQAYMYSVLNSSLRGLCGESHKTLHAND